MAAHSLPDELPVLHAVVREETLPPEGACHGHAIGEDQWCFAGRAELRQGRRGASEVLFGIIDGPQDATVTFDELFRIHLGDEIQVEQSVAAEALLQGPTFGLQSPPQLGVRQRGEQADHGEGNRRLSNKLDLAIELIRRIVVEADDEACHHLHAVRLDKPYVLQITDQRPRRGATGRDCRLWAALLQRTHHCRVLAKDRFTTDTLTRRSSARNTNDATSQEGVPHETCAFGLIPKKRFPGDESDMQNADPSQLEELIQHLNLLRSEMLELEASGLVGCADVHPEHAASAKNLMHYLALRRHDIRHLQLQLAALGLSSLGRTEPHVMSSLNAVVNLLRRLRGSEEACVRPLNGTLGLAEGALLLEKYAKSLLGTPPAGRNVRIMVTMPPEAATDYELVRDLLALGMDCMRINCAHDGIETWSEMIGNLRRAEKETNKHCKVVMDLAGPKLRTGSVQPGPAVLKYRPQRTALGRVVSPARIWLTPSSGPEIPPEPADAVIPVPRTWLGRLKGKDRVHFTDARGASRAMMIAGVVGDSRWAEAVRTAYIVPGLALEMRRPARKGSAAHVWRTKIGAIPPKRQTLRLKLGDTLVLTRSLQPGFPAKYNNAGKLIHPAQIGVSHPEFFDSVRPGEPIWLDDGKIGGVIRNVAPETASVEITQARPSGEKLGADKGINLKFH
jgi:hypothetical protein